MTAPINGHNLDKKLRRMNQIKSELEDTLLRLKFNLKDDDEKIVWDYVQDAIDFCAERVIQEDERLQMFI